MTFIANNKTKKCKTWLSKDNARFLKIEIESDWPKFSPIVVWKFSSFCQISYSLSRIFSIYLTPRNTDYTKIVLFLGPTLQFKIFYSIILYIYYILYIKVIQKSLTRIFNFYTKKNMKMSWKCLHILLFLSTFPINQPITHLILY